MGAEARPGEKPGAQAVRASRLSVVLDWPADAGRVCRVDHPSRLLRIWELLNEADTELHQVSLPPRAAVRLQRQLDAITSELEQSVSPALAGELDHLIRHAKAAAPTPDQVRVEYAALLGWTGGLVLGVLSQIEAASAKLARGGPAGGGDRRPGC